VPPACFYYFTVFNIKIYKKIIFQPSWTLFSLDWYVCQTSCIPGMLLTQVWDKSSHIEKYLLWEETIWPFSNVNVCVLVLVSSAAFQCGHLDSRRDPVTCSEANKGCPEHIHPFWISREPVAWPWCNMAASLMRPYSASMNSHSPVGLVSQQWDSVYCVTVALRNLLPFNGDLSFGKSQKSHGAKAGL
jgi:hypothetical protein